MLASYWWWDLDSKGYEQSWENLGKDMDKFQMSLRGIGKMGPNPLFWHFLIILKTIFEGKLTWDNKCQKLFIANISYFQ